jgi:hypothetical protein
MPKLIAGITAALLTGLGAAGALASRPALRTVAPTEAQRTAILRAFRAPGAPARCLGVGLAASDHSYATVRFHPRQGCARWGFNGVNVLHRQRSSRWKVLFEASEYSCPRPRIPRQVQRDLGICP